MLTFLLMLLFLGLPGALVVTAKLLAYVRLWQQKEYRLDRMLAYLRYEFDRSGIWDGVLFKMLLAAVLLIFISGVRELTLTLAALLALIYYVWCSERVVLDLIYKRLPRPALRSVRNLLIIVIVALASLSPLVSIVRWLLIFELPIWLSHESLKLTSVISTNADQMVVFVPLSLMLVVLLTATILLIDLLLPVQVALGVLLTGLLASIKRRYLLRLAHRKMTRLSALKVVAITGSYGKTTTKEMLAQILTTEFRVAKTPENNNTDLGIALAILDEVKPDTEVFIAEMGAYTAGEIASATRVARPDISIVTAVAPQHLALFGSMEKLARAKYEIVENMKAGGTAIINYDNKYCRQMLTWAREAQLDTLSFTLEDGDADVRVQNIREVGKSIAFELQAGKKKYEFETKLPTVSYVLNLVAALVAAHKLGIDFAKLVTVVNALEWQLRYLAVIEANTGISYITDSYSSNEQGFVNALQFLSTQKCDGHKVVVTKGILELGKEKTTVYSRLAKQFTEVDLLVTSDNELANKVREMQKTKVILVKTEAEFAAQMQSVQAGDLVLLEGRLPEAINVRF